ncbi:MAG: SRPBCC domain-containing protein [Anaerolineales bacterium]|nr:SRPBCC domain-containing protein [Anaerolineales bacterium]
MAAQSLKFEQFIQVPPSMVYHAFTNATALREWLCSLATVQPRSGGRLYLIWNNGYTMAGEYISLHPDQEILFLWRGRGDPGASQVRLTLEAKDNGTLVSLVHEGIGEGEDWQKAVKEIQDGWKKGLENLTSTLETGEDLRITRRPMLGITIGDFNPEMAAKLGVPVTEGIRIDTVVDGLGAQAAGLQSNDVIVSFDGRQITNWASLTDALQGKQAGDSIEVNVYRGSQKVTLMMELSHRRKPAIPASLPALAESIRQHYEQMQAELDKFFAGVSEQEASFKPTPEEWSPKEVLAHLIQGERYWQFHIAELVGSQESWTDDWPGNLEPAILATVAAFPTLADLLAELKRLFLETQVLFANLPAQFAERKSTFWRLSYEALETPYHLYAHLDQMRTAINLARAK